VSGRLLPRYRDEETLTVQRYFAALNFNSASYIRHDTRASIR
jgi:hypothetical protein